MLLSQSTMSLRASGCLYWICCGSNLTKRRLANINQLTSHIWCEHLTMANLTPSGLMFIHRMLLITVEFQRKLSLNFRLQYLSWLQRHHGAI